MLKLPKTKLKRDPKDIWMKKKETMKRHHKKKKKETLTMLKRKWCTHYDNDVYRKDKRQPKPTPKKEHWCPQPPPPQKKNKERKKEKEQTPAFCQGALHTYLVVRLSLTSCNIEWNAIHLLGSKLCCQSVALSKPPEQRMKMSQRRVRTRGLL